MTSVPRVWSHITFVLLGASCAAERAFAPEPAEHAEPRRVVQRIPGSTVDIELVRLPSGLWMSRTEIAWDAFDVFVYGLAEGDGEAALAGADALSRPSQPYVTMDRGFGHDGWPALSMSLKGAEAFCAWLAALTGRSFRLPTEGEWERACRADGASAWGAHAPLDASAWHRGNADRRTHPVGTRAPNAWGLCDMAGNAAEWCRNADGSAAVRGGSYRDAPEDVGADARVLPSAAWNASDPQLPKSTWWLADAGFVGFRVVCEDD
jgi:formylglycine-generating enzyme required for sulfatase activity